MAIRRYRLTPLTTPPDDLIKPGNALPRQTHQDLIARRDIPRFPTLHRIDIDPLNPLIIQYNGDKRRYYGNFAAFPTEN